MKLVLSKPLSEMTSTEKGKLLLFLFPDEIPGFINYQQEQNTFFLKKPEELLLNWESKFGTLAIWKVLATESTDILKKYARVIYKEPDVFGLLFEDYLSPYTIHYLTQYLSENKFQTPKFPGIVNILFN